MKNKINTFFEKIFAPVDLMVFMIWIELTKGALIILVEYPFGYDYVSYMEQAKLFVDGERNLTSIEAENGKAYYPASHLYTFSVFYKLTGILDHYKYAQILLLFIHLVMNFVTVKIYKECFKDAPRDWWLLAVWALNTRLVENWARGLFAESFNVTLTYIAIYLFQKQQQFAGIIFIGLALTYKMNVLLYIPAVYYLTSLSRNIYVGTFYLAIIVSMSFIFAIPFLTEYRDDYMKTAFNFSRKFSIHSSVLYYWLIPKPIFNSSIFGAFLLSGHIGGLIYVLFTRWLPLLDENKKFNFVKILKRFFRINPSYREHHPYFVAEVFFVCNYMGTAFSRTLHQQFIIWFWYSIPILLYPALK